MPNDTLGQFRRVYIGSRVSKTMLAAFQVVIGSHSRIITLCFAPPLFVPRISFPMASLLQITKASKSYGDQVLLDNAEATISDNVKVGFIGRNGAGKSTLLRISNWARRYRA